jgi:hypothetical protein
MNLKIIKLSCPRQGAMLIMLFVAIFSLMPGQAGAQTAASKCESAEVELIFRNEQGEFLTGISYELYEQSADVDGNAIAGKKVTSGKIDKTSGKAIIKFTPAADRYLIKAYDKNAKVAVFSFSGETGIYCGSTRSITKYLSGIRFVFRDSSGSLRKNLKFSLYSQKADIDNSPIKIKEELIASNLDTGDTGETMIYVPDSSHFPNESGGSYVLSAPTANNGTIEEFGIKVYAERMTQFNYVFGDILFAPEDAAGRILTDKKFDIYKQETNAKGEKILGKLIGGFKPDSAGLIRFEYVPGMYAARIKDDGKSYFTFWNLELIKNARSEKNIVTGLVRIKATDKNGAAMPEKTAISVYDLTGDDQGNYYRNKKILSLKIGAIGYAEATLAPDHYLFTVTDGKSEYGRIVEVEQSKLANISLAPKAEETIVANQKFKIGALAKLSALGKKLAGYILLQIERKGEAWYVEPVSAKRYYLKNGDTAYQIMRKFGLGITDENLKKIPIGLDDRLAGYDDDYDSDGLPNKTEEAIGTDMYNYDSDQDGVSDGDEIRNNGNPQGSGNLTIDNNLVARLKGKILIQVKNKGQAWYLNPRDGKRYYLRDGISAFEIMRFLSLGITDANISGITEGTSN